MHMNFTDIKKKYIYDLYKDICNFNCIIFGDAVRDYVKNKLPNNIDIHITQNNYEKLQAFLKIKYNLIIYSDTISKINNNQYFFNKVELFKNAIILKKGLIKFIGQREYDIFKSIYDVNEINKIYNIMSIKLNLVIIKTEFEKHNEFYNGGSLYPPFENPDFDVNLLFMYNNRYERNELNQNDINNLEEEVPMNSHIQLDIKPLNYLLKIYPFPESIRHKQRDKLTIMDTQKHLNYILSTIYKNINNSIAIPIIPNFTVVRKLYSIENIQDGLQIDFNSVNKMMCKNYIIDLRKSISFLEDFEISLSVTDIENTYNYLKNNISLTENTVQDGDNAVSILVENDSHADKCIICLNEFTDIQMWVKYKNCCNVKMHIQCFISFVTNQIKNMDNLEENRTLNIIKCPHCRASYKKCPCDIVNYMRSISHKIRVKNNDIKCDRCYNNKCYNNKCSTLSTWYLNCYCSKN